MLVSERWQHGWRCTARQSADLCYDKMRECREVIVDIISLLFKYPTTSGIRHVGVPLMPDKRDFTVCTCGVLQTETTPSGSLYCLLYLKLALVVINDNEVELI